MKLRIVSVGRERADALAPLVQDYLQRLARFLPVEDEVLKADREDRLATRMLAERGAGHLLVALDERGEELDSFGLARLVERWMGRGQQQVSFLIGGADGLPAGVREAADHVLALSRLTLPHRFARLLLAEQLYRALTIIRSVPYQK